MKKLQSILLSCVLVVSAILLVACGSYPQLETDAKLDMSGKYVASSDTDLENSLGGSEELNLSKKGYHLTVSQENEAGEIYINNYAKLNERGGIREFAGKTIEKYISKDGYKFQLQYETYVKGGRIYVQMIAKAKAVLKGKDVILKKQITYQAPFNNEFIVDEDNLTVYNGLYLDDQAASEAYFFMDMFTKSILEDAYSITKTVNGTTSKFKTTVDYSKVDKTTTSLSKLTDNIIVTNKVITGFEYASNLKFGMTDSLGGMSVDLNGLKIAYVEFDDEIEFDEGIDKYSTILPNLMEVNSVYDDFMAKIESEYEDLSFGFDFNFDFDFGGDDWEDDDWGDDDSGEKEALQGTPITYDELMDELFDSYSLNVNFDSSKYYTYTYSEDDVVENQYYASFSNTSNGLIFNELYSEELIHYLISDIQDFKFDIQTQIKEEMVYLYVDVDGYYPNDSSVNVTIDKTYTYKCTIEEFKSIVDENSGFSAPTLNLALGYLNSEKNLSLNMIENNITSFAYSEDFDITKEVSGGNTIYRLRDNNSYYDDFLIELTVKDGKIIKYYQLEDNGFTKELINIDTVTSIPFENINTTNWSETEPDLTEAINYLNDWNNNFMN